MCRSRIVSLLYAEETMVSRESGRTPRQVFGAMLRYYRERAGLSRTELARQINKSVSLIQAIELGQRAATAEVTEDLERVLPADGALTRLREEIGDGLGYQAYPSWFQEWLVSEREAKKLRTFEPLLVPGLLQTEEYARAIFRARFGMTDEEIDERVAARLKRQQRRPAVRAVCQQRRPAVRAVCQQRRPAVRAVCQQHALVDDVGPVADSL